MSAQQIEYAMRRFEVRPIGRVGIARVFDATARARIEAALRATGALAAEPVAAEVRA